MQKYQEPFWTQTGPAGYCSVLVKTYPGGVVATIYDDDGVTTKANPMTTDGLGNAPFYAANGRYQITVSGSNVVTTTKTDIILFDPSDYVLPGDFTVDGNLTINETLTTDRFQYSNKWWEAGKLELIAHRGFLNQFPQNTLLAMSMALSRGADSLECDVMPSSDGVLYVFHDTTVDLLTNGTGTFIDLTSTYIDSLTFDALAGTALATTQITRFDNFLSFARTMGVKIYPEIKAIRTTADIDAMVQAVIDADMEYLTMFQSFALSDIQYVRSINPTIEVGYLGSDASYATPVADVQALGFGSLLWSATTILANPAIVEYCYSRGVGLGAWTIDEDYVARKLMKLGVNKIMANVSIGSIV
jgi:glycerophosphoryl diester phosphodiesterase